MPTVTWDAAFELIPADTDEYKYGANKIRQLKVGIRERIETEHDFANSCLHLPGKVSCLYSGNTADIANLTGMSEGGLAWDTDLFQWKRYSGASWIAHSTIPKAAAGGTVDAITCTFSPALTALANNLIVCVIASGANTLTNPTFAPNGLTVKTIVKGSNQVLVAGDIPGANSPILLQYNLSLDKWILINPAYAVSVPAGRVLQTQRYTTGAVSTTSAVTPNDDTIPQNVDGEGKVFMSLDFTPVSASSKLRFDIVFVGEAIGGSGPGNICVFLCKDSDADALACAVGYIYTVGGMTTTITFNHSLDSPGLSTYTFKVRAGVVQSNYILTINGNSGGRKYGGIMASSITITEIL